MKRHIRRFAGRQRSKNPAFTLVEIMIVILIIGILLSIATPNFIRAREVSRSKACTTNLSEIDAAKEQYAFDNKLATGAAAPAMSSLAGTVAYIKFTPTCPSGGSYTIDVIGTSPSCSIGANSAARYAPHVAP